MSPFVPRLFLFSARIKKTTRSKSSPNDDQHRISPCNINASLTPEVMRIKDMITQGGFSCTSPEYFYKISMEQERRICSLILGLRVKTARSTGMFLLKP